MASAGSMETRCLVSRWCGIRTLILSFNMVVVPPFLTLETTPCLYFCFKNVGNGEWKV